MGTDIKKHNGITHNHILLQVKIFHNQNIVRNRYNYKWTAGKSEKKICLHIYFTFYIEISLVAVAYHLESSFRHIFTVIQ
jgi:hypothetical protein